jgi:hypothetical protein
MIQEETIVTKYNLNLSQCKSSFEWCIVPKNITTTIMYLATSLYIWLTMLNN